MLYSINKQAFNLLLVVNCKVTGVHYLFGQILYVLVHDPKTFWKLFLGRQ